VVSKKKKKSPKWGAICERNRASTRVPRFSLGRFYSWHSGGGSSVEFLSSDVHLPTQNPPTEKLLLGDDNYWAFLALILMCGNQQRVLVVYCLLYSVQLNVFFLKAWLNQAK